MEKNWIISEENYQETMETVVEPFLEACGQELFLDRGGGQAIHCVRYRAQEPRGVVLISHGFTESAQKYNEACYYFLKEHYHVYVLEHCGHGKSYRLTQDPSLVHVDRCQRYVDDLLLAARRAKQDEPELPLYLYAHSMGGGVGAAAAAQEPGLFEKLVLTSPMLRPQTGTIPWGAAKMAVNAMCLMGKKTAYANGRPYEGKERFEESASLSRARFDYYQEKKATQVELQTSAATFGWLREAVRLNTCLWKKAVKTIQAPVLLFQAQQEQFVSNDEQRRFVDALKARGIRAELVFVENAKHEIFNSLPPVLEAYWKRIFEFLDS